VTCATTPISPQSRPAAVVPVSGGPPLPTPIQLVKYNMGAFMSPPDVCVFCRRLPVDRAWRPFCSERCRLQDLAQWADETYRIPDEPVPSPEDGHDEDDNR
jgi:endogenous inhibitor of DNA gyrase (YacG/DUF329 family)